MKKKLSTTKLVLIVLGLILLLLIGTPLVSLFGPVPAIVVSKETTYVTGPLDDEGRVDYLAAIEQKDFADLPPEENAAREYVQAFAPDSELSGVMRIAVFERLDLRAGGGPYLEDVVKFAARHEDLVEQTRRGFQRDLGRPSSDVDAPDEFARRPPDTADYVYHWQDVSQRRPWTGEEFPLLAAWLDDQQQPLAHIRRGVQQQRCYFPLIRRSQDESMLSLSLYYHVPVREAGRQLSSEAMRQLGSGDRESAWQSIRVMLIMGRHLSEQPSLVGNLVGIVIGDKGLLTLGDALHFGNYTDEELARIAAEFDQVGLLEPIAEEFRGGERMWMLDAMTAQTAGEQAFAELDTEMLHVPGVDGNIVLRKANGHFDRLIRVAEAQPSEREDLDAWCDQLTIDARANLTPAKLLAGAYSRKARSEAVGDIHCALLLPAVTVVFQADDRYRVRRDCARAAIALAQHRAVHGEYPEKLAQLVPEFAEQQPQDLFTGQPLKYLRTAEGYQLYSVGPNRQDNGGLDARQDDTGSLDRDLHDDWGITVPSPLPVPHWEEPEVLEESEGAEPVELKEAAN